MASLLKRAWLTLYSCYGVRNHVTLGKNLHLGLGSMLDATVELTVGDDVYIGKGCTIECNGSIGNGVMIANRVGLIGRHDHDFRAVGKTIRNSPWIGDADFRAELRNERLIIHDDVWIGYGSIVLSGVIVGRGAIVAAGSVVTKNIPPYAIAAGVPARVVGERFDNETITKHEIAIYGRRMTE